MDLPIRARSCSLCPPKKVRLSLLSHLLCDVIEPSPCLARPRLFYLNTALNMAVPTWSVGRCVFERRPWKRLFLQEPRCLANYSCVLIPEPLSARSACRLSPENQLTFNDPHHLCSGSACWSQVCILEVVLLPSRPLALGESAGEV